jgi:hypothetical protein
MEPLRNTCDFYLYTNASQCLVLKTNPLVPVKYLITTRTLCIHGFWIKLDYLVSLQLSDEIILLQLHSAQ